MNEVKEFLFNNPDISPVLREFLAEHSSLADAWAKCKNSYWMLLLLDRRKYRNVEILERYIEWLLDKVRQNDENLLAQELQQLKGYKQWVDKQIDEGLEAKRMTQAEAVYRRYSSAYGMARNLCKYVLKKKFLEAELENRYEKYRTATEGSNPLKVGQPVIDDPTLKEQADKLRELIGNPFTPEGAGDFYYGKGQF